MNKLNRSVARAIDIIDLISASKEEVTIAEISRMLDIPKSSAFDIIYTLVEKGYLEVANQKNKSFKLGLKLYQSGASYLEKISFYDVSHPLLEEISKQVMETTFLAVENDGVLVYMDKVESISSVRTSCRIGSTNPLYCTGLGKALLASYSDERVREIVGKSGLHPVTEWTITTEERLFKELSEARQRGYSIDDRESQPEIFCVAAPIYNDIGKPIAAISIASLFTKMQNNPERVERFGRLIADTALTISRKIGFKGEGLFFELH